MNILEVDGVPCNPVQEVAAAPLPRISTAEKIRRLQSSKEDFEWYPTTPEILDAMEKDIFSYLKSHENDYSNKWRRSQENISLDRDRDTKKQRLRIDSFLDIGAGDGRVLERFPANNKYGIEIAGTQADDLIRRGVFIIGRNFYDVTLFEQDFGLVFCNPPYSEYSAWVNKILYECNFDLLYLVIPVRWKDEKSIAKELERFEATVIGEYDFLKADRAARSKVNLIRVNAPWVKETGENNQRFKTQQTLEDAFERWVREHIADFVDEEELHKYREEEQDAIMLRKTPIDQLIDEYENEKANLGAAFKAIGKLDPAIIKLMGQDKKSMLEIIRKSIEGLKKKYWRAAFEKLEPVQKRMTKKTRERIFDEIKEFRKIDFNLDNVYSIIIWIINNSNIGILDQIGQVFDDLTDKNFIENYKSNRHWAKGDWRNSKDVRDDWKYRDLPDRWKLGLDYRIVVHTYSYDRYGTTKETIVNDFIVVCGNLGFPINTSACVPDYSLHQTEQEFYTLDGELAFTMRFYTGNRNAHLKINKQLLMKFNIEVAKIRRWMSDPGDVVEEYGVTEYEADKLWNSNLALLGTNDVKMLEFKEAV